MIVAFETFSYFFSPSMGISFTLMTVFADILYRRMHVLIVLWDSSERILCAVPTIPRYYPARPEHELVNIQRLPGGRLFYKELFQEFTNVQTPNIQLTIPNYALSIKSVWVLKPLLARGPLDRRLFWQRA